MMGWINRRKVTILGFCVFLGMLSGVDCVNGQEKNNLDERLRKLQKEPLLDEILRTMDERYQKIESIELTFKQTKVMMLMAQPVQSEGILIIQRPDKFFWKFYNPDQTVMVVKGTQLIIHYPDLKQADVLEIEKYKDRVAKYLGFTESMTKLKRYYDIRVIEEGQTAYMLELIPKRRRIKQKIERLEIWLNRESYLPERLDYLEPNGDTTKIKVTKTRVNGPVEDTLFDYVLPDGTTINYPIQDSKDKSLKEDDE
ncbi:outer membrane lipoprotein carrier protein LolA [bacterium]|nr:outer membrane lipoprotein carrier protein LolA [bacterium]